MSLAEGDVLPVRVRDDDASTSGSDPSELESSEDTEPGCVCLLKTLSNRSLKTNNINNQYRTPKKSSSSAFGRLLRRSKSTPISTTVHLGDLVPGLYLFLLKKYIIVCVCLGRGVVWVWGCVGLGVKCCRRIFVETKFKF